MYIDRGIINSSLLKRLPSPTAFVTDTAMLVIVGIDTREAIGQRSDVGTAYHVLLAHVNQGRHDLYWATTIERHDPLTVIEECPSTVAEFVIRSRPKYKT
jgi:hypothetical protein